MNIQGCVPRFIKDHGSLILTILSGVGLIGSVILTAKQAPKAEGALIEAEQDKQAEILKARIDAIEHPDGYTESYYEKVDNVCNDMNDNPPKLSVMEKIKVAGPIYAPVILLGLATIGCMAGAHILDAKKQAAILSAYAMLQQDFKAYRQEIRDEYGEEADRKAWIESQKRVKVLEEEVKRLEGIKGVCNFGIATIPGLIFRSDMGNIDLAMLHFNRNLILRGWASLGELYSFLGLPEDQWKFVHKENDEEYGWNAYIDEVEWGVAFLDYRLTECETKDGEKAYLIDFDVPPYKIEGYEQDDDIETPGETYSGYDPNEAKRMLIQGVDQIPMLIDSASSNVHAPSMYEEWKENRPMTCGW